MRPAGRRPPLPPSLRRTHAGRRRGPPPRPPALRSDGPSVSQSPAFRPPCPVSGPAREQSRGSVRGITLGAWRVPHLPHRPGHGRRRATHVFQWPVCVSSSFVPRCRWPATARYGVLWTWAVTTSLSAGRRLRQKATSAPLLSTCPTCGPHRPESVTDAGACHHSPGACGNRGGGGGGCHCSPGRRLGTLRGPAPSEMPQCPSANSTVRASHC